MNKRKIALLAMSACMIAILAIGGTLAYFTDTDKATNTFTTAMIDITLNEEQRDYVNGQQVADSEIEAFENDKVLYPIVGSAQGEKDSWGLSKAQNYLDKIVTITNTNKSTDAYVRLYYAIPTALDNVTDAGANVLHVNIGNKYDPNGNKQDPDAPVTENWDVETLLKTEVAIEGIEYNVYYRDYKNVMPKDTTTANAALVGCYLDAGVDYVPATENAEGYYAKNGKKIDFDFTKGVNIPVFAVGVQAAGFTTPAAAVDAAFGANYNPWVE